MLYAFLAYHDETVITALTPGEDDALMVELHKVHDQLAADGRLGPAARLGPTAQATTWRRNGDKAMVIDGPFAETKELIAGYWIWQCKSRDEAIEWLKRAPFNEVHNGTTVVEVRQIFSPEDFAPVDPTGELARKEEELRREVEARQKRS